MQKGITPLVILDEDAEAIKKDKLMRKQAKRTIDENLWDSVWLSKLYPSSLSDSQQNLKKRILQGKKMSITNRQILPLLV